MAYNGHNMELKLDKNVSKYIEPWGSQNIAKMDKLDLEIKKKISELIFPHYPAHTCLRGLGCWKIIFHITLKKNPREKKETKEREREKILRKKNLSGAGHTEVIYKGHISIPKEIFCPLKS